MSTKTFSAQPGSARQSAIAAGIQHGQTSEVEVVVGATPAQPNDQGFEQILHFCSTRVRVLNVLVPGDGTKIPDECEVLVEDLQEIPTFSFIRFQGTITSNGALTFKVDRSKPVLRVPIPVDMIVSDLSYPHGNAEGPSDVANRLGCNGNLNMNIVDMPGIATQVDFQSFKEFGTIVTAVGASTMFFGVLTGSYLGDLPKYIWGLEPAQLAPWVDPLTNPLVILKLSLVVGIAHLNLGLILPCWR